ncbi:MAG: class I SAM-dependent methyltransferase [Chloroflexi bacterium]|nr:class I SAM-dependent methyltransferase [Chloroflexota bacterium]
MGVDAQPGLDFDFLRYIGVLPENQRRIQGYYLPYFETRRKVIDLGCGDADFVALLAERGVDVVGVDSDDKACEAAWSRGLPVVKRDLFDYLRDLRANSVDGIFSAHLVEHLPFPNALELVRQSWRVLKPGGVIVLATPNARSLFSHLEMFYLHFGHVSFYHPRLLCFFLEHEGFTRVSHGENPETASPLLAEARQIRDNLADVNLGLDAQESPTGFLPPPAAAPVDNSADMGRWLTALRSGRVAQVAHLSAIGAPPRGQVAYRREIRSNN